MAEKRNRKKRVLKHLGNVSMAIISVSLMSSAALILLLVLPLVRDYA